MIKQLLTYTLLFAFAVIFSPRSSWHSHDEVKKSCAHDNDHDHSDTDEDCYVCDFTLQPALTPVAFQFQFPVPDNYIAAAITLALVDVSDISVHTLRGPPVGTIVC
ncbi:hypothetical protein H9Y05_13690 [Crocinitomicaceae bacterium CZZ-1]|uniref:Uncharacterized protein n=1 Tax=Taishania pollutisoli TaxID=2766479 RepID=A0A8J6U0Q1_9FLAO|nr:hypothetical protein [Taishania pollutisoli]MBC9813523.1 hypothetical protein [Taishania pollutisoli]